MKQKLIKKKGKTTWIYYNCLGLVSEEWTERR